jgi:acetylserotonin N-methyltransferase
MRNLNPYEMPTSDDTAIWDTWLSMHYLPTVTTADELGIFRSLLDAPASAGELAKRMGFNDRATRATLRLLASLGFLMQRLERYQVTDTARLYLLRESPFYWGHMLGNRMPQAERLRDCLQNKRPTWRPGSPNEPKSETGGSVDGWSAGHVDLERGRRVARAMQSHSLPAANAFARNAEVSGVNRFLDVGGGSGCFAIALARAHPDLHCAIMELRTMCDVAQDYIREGGVEGRVATLAVDMFREPWPVGYDALFFSNVFHDWDFETCDWLSARAFEALPSGGRIMLHEMLLDDDGDGPVTAASFSMLMLLGTQGQQFTLPELKRMLEGAGFVNVDARHSYGYYSVVTAYKP